MAEKKKRYQVESEAPGQMSVLLDQLDIGASPRETPETPVDVRQFGQETTREPISYSGLLEEAMMSSQDIDPTQQADTDEIAVKSVITGESPEQIASDKDSDFPWGDFLVGATPVLMGFLAGEPQVGFERGAQGLLQRHTEKREDSQEARKLASKMAANVAEPEEFTPKDYYHPETGKTYIGRWSRRRGLVKRPETDPISGGRMTEEQYARRRQISTREAINKARATKNTIRVDEEGRLVVANPMTEKVKILSDLSDLSPKQKKDAQQTVEKYNSEVSKDIDSAYDFKESFNDLIEGNQLGQKLAVMRFVREVEQRLSDADRLYYTKEVSDLKDWHRYLDELSTNKMNPRLIRETMEKLGSAMKKMKDRVSSKRKRYKSQYQARHKDIKDEKIEEIFGIRPDFGEGVVMFKEEKGKKTKFKEVPWDLVGEGFDNGYQILGR